MLPQMLGIWLGKRHVWSPWQLSKYPEASWCNNPWQQCMWNTVEEYKTWTTIPVRQEKLYLCWRRKWKGCLYGKLYSIVNSINNNRPTDIIYCLNCIDYEFSVNNFIVLNTNHEFILIFLVYLLVCQYLTWY